MFGLLRDLYRYRSFILTSAWRDIQGQYQGALLGISWALIAPLAMLSIYTVIFAGVMGSRLPGNGGMFSYSIFLCAGLLPWTYFSDALSRLTSVFVAYGNLIKKTNFPRICLPFIALSVSSFNFLIIIAIFLVFLILSGNFPGMIVLAALPALVIQILLTLGFGVLFGSLNVFFRDIGQLIGVGFQFAFWLTPIVYPLSSVPKWAQEIILLNPFTTLVQHYQLIFLHAQLPDAVLWRNLGFVGILSILGIYLGLRLYRRHAGDMTDEL